MFRIVMTIMKTFCILVLMGQIFYLPIAAYSDFIHTQDGIRIFMDVLLFVFSFAELGMVIDIWMKEGKQDVRDELMMIRMEKESLESMNEAYKMELNSLNRKVKKQERIINSKPIPKVSRIRNVKIENQTDNRLANVE